MAKICESIEVLVDPEDEHWLSRYSWRVQDGYIRSATTRNGRRLTLYLHRLILGAAKGQIVDHINGVRSDNRRANLRFVTIRQNALNAAPKATGKKGHAFRGLKKARNGSFAAVIRDGKRQIHLGLWKNPVEAAYNYDMASLQIHGEHGRRNFLPLVR